METKRPGSCAEVLARARRPCCGLLVLLGLSCAATTVEEPQRTGSRAEPPARREPDSTPPDAASSGSVPATVAEAEAMPGPEATREGGKAGDGSRSELEETWGIRVIAVRRSAAGYMLDFRYRVTDPEKAAPLFERGIKPYLIDQASGAKMAVPNPPKIGPLRASGDIAANRNYFIMFANPAQYIKKGNKVTVVIGDFRAEDLTVE